MHRLLIIEDDSTLAAGLSRALASGEAETEICGTLKEAGEKIFGRRGAGQKEEEEKTAWDLILLDVNLPDGSGFDFLAQLRQKISTPVILLTANDMETDIVTGLELGADDYITKPFSLAVLRARVNTQLRRAGEDRKGGKNSGERQERTEGTRIGPYYFHFGEMRFEKDGEAVELSKTEQKLLRLFVENRGITLERARLIDRIWTDGAEYVDENALSVTVKRLRDKLDAQKFIRTVYGIGYTWVKEEE